MIKMFKAHFLQKSWHSLSTKCDVSLDDLEKAAPAPKNPMEQRHWKSYTIRDALWHVRDVWKKVTVSYIWGAWKKLCTDFAVDFGGFDLSGKLYQERLKCLELVRKVGLDEVEEDDVDSLLESIGYELSTEELDELEKQRRQLERRWRLSSIQRHHRRRR